MKRLVFLFCLLFGITAAAQELQNSARYEHFIELRNESDTLRMKQMLDDWGAKDAEYYAAWSNYCSIMAEETEDSSWLGLAVNWIKMGLEEYPDDVLLLLKRPQVLYDNEQYQEALLVLQELEEKGLDEASCWYYSSSIYILTRDHNRARQYLQKMIQEGDEQDRAYAEDVLQTIDKVEHVVDSLCLVPDHAAIRKFAETEDFQRLVTRFEACDTTLTREEISNLYYGSAYKKDYNLVSASNESIQKLLEEDKIQEAIDALQAELKEYPVSLYLLVSIFNLTEDPAVLEPVVWKAQRLLEIIDNSGRGTVDSPLQVICVNDEYQELGQVERMQGLKSQVLVEEAPLAPLDQMTFVNSFGLDDVLNFYLTPPYWERLHALFD
jgi:hypothetical protein